MGRAKSLMEYGTRLGFEPGADQFVPAGKNTVLVGGWNEIEFADQRDTTIREFGGKPRTAAGRDKVARNQSPNVDLDEDEFINRTFRIPDARERFETTSAEVADALPGKAPEYRVKKFGDIFRILNENDAVIDEFDTEAEAKAEKKELDDQREYEQLEDSPPPEEINVLDEDTPHEDNDDGSSD